MIYSLKVQMLFSILIAIGCVISPIFASIVVSGAAACALGALGVFAYAGGPDHPVNRVLSIFPKAFRFLRQKTAL